jgi:general transcription factor 3C polypeptide 5 (transcription factor C subunit 1)
MSVETTVIDEKTGQEKKRLINKSRWKGFGPATISFSEKTVRCNNTQCVCVRSVF